MRWVSRTSSDRGIGRRKDKSVLEALIVQIGVIGHNRIYSAARRLQAQSASCKRKHQALLMHGWRIEPLEKQYTLSFIMRTIQTFVRWLLWITYIIITCVHLSPATFCIRRPGLVCCKQIIWEQSLWNKVNPQVLSGHHPQGTYHQRSSRPRHEKLSGVLQPSPKTCMFAAS